jgi:urease accessory protein UreE
MLCNRILGTTHHGTYKKVVDVPLLREELSARSIRCIARDGVEIEIDVYEDLQEGDILAETDFNVYAVKIYVPKKKPAKENSCIFSNLYIPRCLSLCQLDTV